MERKSFQERIQWIDFLGWFDSAFFAYNLLLFTAAVFIPPLITWIYLRSMKGEKCRRLGNEIPAEIWNKEQCHVGQLLDAQFTWRLYWGSLAIFTLVLVLGASIALFLKPVMSVDGVAHTPGLDFGKGANVLMLGPFAGQAPGESFGRLIFGLAAFQYGFLGAFTHNLGQLARSYFTLDLTPHTYVDSTVRIATGSLVALVLSFLFDVDKDAERSLLPVASFFVGFFPARGLLAIEKAATAGMKWLQKDGAQAESLSILPGMSYAHELRLNREGFDTVENIGNGNALELAVRTGFSYPQLAQWIDQAWLASHLRGGYAAFVERTAITSRSELRQFRDGWEGGPGGVDAASYLAGGDRALAIRIAALFMLA